LAAGDDSNHVIACVDQIAESGAAEETTAATSAFSGSADRATDRGLRRAKIDFSWRAAACATASGG
jgi:hypothetical protein